MVDHGYKKHTGAEQKLTPNTVGPRTRRRRRLRAPSRIPLSATKRRVNDDRPDLDPMVFRHQATEPFVRPQNPSLTYPFPLSHINHILSMLISIFLQPGISKLSPLLRRRHAERPSLALPAKSEERQYRTGDREGRQGRGEDFGGNHQGPQGRFEEG